MSSLTHSTRRGIPAARLLVLVAWVCFVWGHSLVPGVASDAESLSVVARVSPLLGALGIRGTHAMNHVVRKLGHFSEYLVLGIVASWALRPAWLRGSRVGERAAKRDRPAEKELSAEKGRVVGGTSPTTSVAHAGTWATLAVCVLVPCVDETIQLFVPRRSGMVSDVCLDMVGCACGLLATRFLCALRRLWRTGSSSRS